MKKLAYIILFCMSGLMLNSCKNPMEEINPTIDANLIKNAVHLEIIDPANESSPPANVKITFEGRDAEAVYELGAGNKKFKVQEGMLSLGMNPNTPPTESTPLTFNVKLSAPGYLPVNQVINVFKGEEEQVVTIPMVSLTNPPKGVSVKESTALLTGNAAAEDIKVATQLTQGQQETMEITIAEGTKFYDKNNNPISGSKLNISVVYFDSRTEESQAAYPGGLMAQNVTMPDGSKQNIAFITGGFAAIDMKIGNTEVRKFDKPVAVHMEMANTVTNPETGQDAKAGDKIPVWSYEVETGEWKYEQEAEIKEQNGKLAADYTISHLSYYNLDYCYWQGMVCNGHQGYMLTSSNGALKNFDAVQTKLYIKTNSGYQYLVSSYSYIGSITRFIQSYRVPNTQGKIEVYSSDGQYKLLEKNINFCELSGSTIDITVTPPPPVVTVKFSGICRFQTNMLVRPTGIIYYRPAYTNRPFKKLGTMKNGFFQTKLLELYKEYEFKGYQGGSSYSTVQYLSQYNIDIQNVELPEEVCKCIKVK